MKRDVRTEETPRIPCHHCAGSGEVELSPHLLAVLIQVRKSGEATASDLHASLATPILVTAFNNRLEQLRKLGFLVRDRRDGKTWVYQPAKARK